MHRRQSYRAARCKADPHQSHRRVESKRRYQQGAIGGAQGVGIDARCHRLRHSSMVYEDALRPARRPRRVEQVAQVAPTHVGRTPRISVCAAHVHRA